MTNADRCPDCGANLAMVGKMHRCVPRSRGGVERVPGPTQTRAPDQREIVREQSAGVTPIPSLAKPEVASGPRETDTKYRYRDPDKWREYMRDYMRRRRAQKAS